MDFSLKKNEEEVEEEEEERKKEVEEEEPNVARARAEMSSCLPVPWIELLEGLAQGCHFVP